MGNLGVGAREVDGQHGQSAQDRPQGRSRVWGVRRNKPPEWMTVKPKTPSSTRRLPPGGVGGCSGSSLFSLRRHSLEATALGVTFIFGVYSSTAMSRATPATVARNWSQHARQG